MSVCFGPLSRKAGWQSGRSRYSLQKSDARLADDCRHIADSVALELSVGDTPALTSEPTRFPSSRNKRHNLPSSVEAPPSPPDGVDAAELCRTEDATGKRWLRASHCDGEITRPRCEHVAPAQCSERGPRTVAEYRGVWRCCPITGNCPEQRRIVTRPRQ